MYKLYDIILFTRWIQFEDSPETYMNSGSNIMCLFSRKYEQEWKLVESVCS